jgi:hypothetical protein
MALEKTKNWNVWVWETVNGNGMACPSHPRQKRPKKIDNTDEKHDFVATLLVRMTSKNQQKSPKLSKNIDFSCLRTHNFL